MIHNSFPVKRSKVTQDSLAGGESLNSILQCGIQIVIMCLCLNMIFHFMMYEMLHTLIILPLNTVTPWFSLNVVLTVYAVTQEKVETEHDNHWTYLNFTCFGTPVLKITNILSDPSDTAKILEPVFDSYTGLLKESANRPEQLRFLRSVTRSLDRSLVTNNDNFRVRGNERELDISMPSADTKESAHVNYRNTFNSTLNKNYEQYDNLKNFINSSFVPSITFSGNENVRSKGNSTIHLNSQPNSYSRVLKSLSLKITAEECNEVYLDNESINATISHLALSTKGAVSFGAKWSANAITLKSLDIRADGGINLPERCEWIPVNMSKIKLSGPLKELSTGHCDRATDIALKHVTINSSIIEVVKLCLPSLDVLFISWGGLVGKGPEEDCEDGVSGVNELILSHNELTTWSSCGWSSLNVLHVEHNNISTMDFSSCKQHNLQHIYARNNQLTMLPSDLPVKLLVLDMSYNKIQQLSHIELSLLELHLSHNILTEMGKGVFRKAWSLVYLDLSFNRISTIYGNDFLGLRHLKHLNLKHNKLKHIRHRAFKPLLNLESLDISHNSLVQLDVRLISGFPKIVHIHLHHNPWHCSCSLLRSLAFLTKVPCHPTCSQQLLYCTEDHVRISAVEVLTKCLQAVSDVSKTTTKQQQHSATSDEDVSEERTGAEGASYGLMIIPAIVSLVLLLGGAIVIRKIYLDRKRLLRKCCDCLQTSASETSTSSYGMRESKGHKSKVNQFQGDTDSETEL